MAFKLLPEWIPVPSSLTVYSIITILVSLTVIAGMKRRKFIQRVEKVPGMPGALPLIGNTHMLALLSPEDLFKALVALIETNRNLGSVLRGWEGPFPIFFLFTAEAFEVVLGSNKLIDKSRLYDFLHPWLNTGLLTSTGTKWFSRRKLLTPTFHFKILEDFVQVFNEHSNTLVEELDKVARDEKDCNIYPFITRCALDIINDTAMRVKIDSQRQPDSDYVKAIYSMSNIVQTRQSRPWLQPDFLFKRTQYGEQQRKNLEILHSFTDEVIQKRKIEYKQRKGEADTKDHENELISKKPRLAFLDLLIEASQDGTVLSDLDIREEVDTFMFEGHDTTTAAINWSLLLIGSDPKVQERVHEELREVLGDSKRSITMADLSELKYLECCIKEALRLYPSVPLMGRTLSEDTDLHGFNIPAGSNVLLMPYILHRDPKHFPDPELFQPERFFSENSRGRHPYAYVPFSAGARNCIGQKFALMEEKVILGSIFRNFYVEALDKRDELILIGELILRPRDGIRLRLTKLV